LLCRHGARGRTAFWIHHHLSREPQIDGIDTPGCAAPLIDIFNQ
jgi:hypothetical protein